MPYTDKIWKGWGKRFKDALRAKDSNLAKVSEKMGLAESTLRSWTNNTRAVNLADFFWLCSAAGIDPQLILFAEDSPQKVYPTDEKRDILIRAWESASPMWREQLTITAEAILKSRGATRSK